MRELRDGIGERDAPGAVNGILNAQAQFLDVKWLGDVIIGAQFQAAQPVAALALFGQEDDGNIARAAVFAQAAGHFKPIDIGQADIQDDKLRQVGLSGAHAVFTPVNGQDFITLIAEECIEHVRNVQIIFHHQQRVFLFHGSAVS